MSEITILLLYAIAAVAFATSRLPRFDAQQRPLHLSAFLLLAIGIGLHIQLLQSRVLLDGGFDLAIGHVVSLIGLELAVIAFIGALQPALRGISAGLLLLAAVATALTDVGPSAADTSVPGWQAQAHILSALMSYGLATVGAIVAIFALAQDRRLRSRNLASPGNNLFAPLETTERLLFAITATTFAGLLVAITLGLTFVSDLFAQHLAHKSTLAILALVVFGVLLLGRTLAGWRGARAVRIYLAAWVLLCLAYFGSRVILEELLGRSWS